MKARFEWLMFSSVLPKAILMWAHYSTRALACTITSDGSAAVGGVAKFTPSSCNIENSAMFESSGKVSVGSPASGGFEFQVSAPNEIGQLIRGPASGVGDFTYWEFTITVRWGKVIAGGCNFEWVAGDGRRENFTSDDLGGVKLPASERRCRSNECA